MTLIFSRVMYPLRSSAMVILKQQLSRTAQ